MNYKQLEAKMLRTLEEREQQKLLQNNNHNNSHYYNNKPNNNEPSASIMFKGLSLETNEDEVI